ncbi:MAG: hypothetical protein QOH97_3352 [Actinoplanes sp.]|jgi:hypothetical protein|nr:hypothetical protein [Actinoplanes sp.]
MLRDSVPRYGIYEGDPDDRIGRGFQRRHGPLGLGGVD